MEITPLAPPSVQLVPAKEYNGAPIGTSYDVRAYIGELSKHNNRINIIPAQKKNRSSTVLLCWRRRSQSSLIHLNFYNIVIGVVYLKQIQNLLHYSNRIEKHLQLKQTVTIEANSNWIYITSLIIPN